LLAGEYYLKPKAYLDIESGKFIFKKLIKIKDEKIIAIVDEDQKKIEKNKVVKLEDLYLVPGFIDCHTHVLLTQTIEDQSLENALERESKLDDEFRIKRSLNFLKDYLRAGFTSLCEMGNSGQFLDYKLKLITADKKEYPSLFISGPGLATGKAQFKTVSSLERVKKEYNLITNESDFNLILKIYLDNSPGNGSLDESILKKIIQSPYLSHFKKVTYHATTLPAFQLALKFNLKSLEHFYSYQMNEDSLAQFEYITPTDLDRETLMLFNLYHKVFFDNQINRLKLLKRNHINIVFGSDLYFHKTSALFDRGYHAKKSISNYIEAGFQPLEILKILSLNPAKSLKQTEQIGAIKVNAHANILGFKTNPLENILGILERPLVINKGEVLK